MQETKNKRSSDKLQDMYCLNKWPMGWGKIHHSNANNPLCFKTYLGLLGGPGDPGTPLATGLGLMYKSE